MVLIKFHESDSILKTRNSVSLNENATWIRSLLRQSNLI